MKTAIGIVTFGNHEFTRLALTQIVKTVTRPMDVYLVIGKPGDIETISLCTAINIDFIQHDVNKGFPASINDLYDYAWLGKNPRHLAYDNLIIMGNDVVPYPNAIDALIEQAEISDYEWISSCQYDVKSLVRDHPEAAKFFKGPNYEFTDFSSRPWNLHGPENIRPHRVEDGVIKDVHNLCLFKRSVFEKIGYIDVNFFPAYFSDNDYGRRGWKEGLKTCSLDHSAYFHFWSRTIHQGSGGSTPRYFQLNEEFYRAKWGGPVEEEVWDTPFGGNAYRLENGIYLPGNRKIDSRADEERIVNYWKSKG